MRRKNLKIRQVSENLVDANYIASFLGISLNALYLRMHFENFPKSLKINGKLFFDLNVVMAYIQNAKEQKAYAYLAQDEIRSYIDLGKISREQIGQILCAKSPGVTGGAIYLRPISFDRAKFLYAQFEALEMRLEISTEQSYYAQQLERLEYISLVWESLCTWIDTKLIKPIQIAKWINQTADTRMAMSFYKNGPSYKISKIIKLKALQNGLL
jgi:predicted DNA-binding transcriptional regulator AlpA